MVFQSQELLCLGALWRVTKGERNGVLITAEDKGRLENESCREEVTNDPAVSWELARGLRLPVCPTASSSYDVPHTGV